MTFVPRAWRLALVLAVLALAAGLAVPALAKNADVSIVGTSFQPATITVGVGDTVTWTTTQSIGQQHSVTSGKPGAADSGKAFDSGIVLTKNGDTYSFTFPTAGEYDYYCIVHGAAMSGHVTVVAAAGGGASASPGSSAGSAASPASSSEASPAASGAEASPEPAVAEHAPVDPTTKLVAGAILIVALALLFGAAWAYRRANRMA